MALQLDSIALAAEELAKGQLRQADLPRERAMRACARGRDQVARAQPRQVNTNYDSATGFRHGPKTVL